MLSYKDFFISISNDTITLKDALKKFKECSSDPSDIPFIIRLVENPNLKLPLFRVFNGAVDLYTHDCIHLILGRGLLPKDEAFVIGFTMGSTKKMFKFEKFLYHFITEYLYPHPFKFTHKEHMVFDIASAVATISKCERLDKIDFKKMENLTLKEIREKIGLEEKFLLDAYTLESDMFPDEKDSKRLLL